MRVRWQPVLVVVLTAALLWLFFSNLDLRETWAAIRRAHLPLLAAATVVVMVTYALRAWRWLFLLQPIGHARFTTAFRTTVVGFAVTFLLPARLGEVLRPYLLARREGLNASSTFATVIIERLLDLFTVVLLFGTALIWSDTVVSDDVQRAGAAAAVVAVSGLIVLAVLAGHPERLRGWAERATRWLPERAGAGVGHFVQTFTEGLKVLRSPAHLALAVAWSLPLWGSIALSIWLTSRAFDLTFPFVSTFLVVGLLVVGVAAPTPGGAGGFHAMYLLALTQFFDANPNVAGAAAIVLHAVSFVPVTLLGLLFMWQDGLTLGSLKRMRTEPV